MSDKDYVLLTFKSTHAAMAAQKVLKELSFRICPVLRMISASCGIALRIEPDKAERARELLNESSLNSDMYDIYLIYYEDNVQNFKKI